LVPGFRVVAVSMAGLEIGIAGILAPSVARVHRKLVSLLEEQSTIGTAPPLPFAQGGQSGPDRRVPSLSFPPVHPIPVVRTPMARDLCGPPTRGFTMGHERRLTRTGGRRGTPPSGFPVGPVALVHPSSRLLRVSPACPGATFPPGETVQAPTGGLTPPGALIMGPTADGGVALGEQGRLGPLLTRSNQAATLREMALAVVLGRLEQGFKPQTLAMRALAGLGLPDPLWPDVASPTIHARLLPVPGGAAGRFVDLHRPSHPRQPYHPQLLTVGEDCAIRGQPQTVLGIGTDPGVRLDLGDGLVSPMQGHQREERRPRAALRCACGGGGERVRLHAPCASPSSPVPTDARWRWEFRPERRVLEAVKTLRNIALEQRLGPKFAARKDCCQGSPTGPSRAQALEVGRQLGGPLWLSSLAYQRLSRPCVLGWHAQWTLCRAPPFWHPWAPQRGGRAGEPALARQSPSLGRGS
jgi:hypothetical protein